MFSHSKHLLMTCRARDKKIPNFFFFIRLVIKLLSATEKPGRKTRKEKTYRLFLFRRRHPFSGVSRNCLLSCFFVVQNNAIHNTVMRVNNKRKHAHQIRANARVRTRFSTRVYAKIVRAFCVCVGRLSLTCTVSNVCKCWNKCLILFVKKIKLKVKRKRKR